MAEHMETDNMSQTDLEEEARLAAEARNADVAFENKLDNWIGGLQDSASAMDTSIPGEHKRSFGETKEKGQNEGYLNFGDGVQQFLGRKKTNK